MLTELFYTVNFSVAILASIVGLIFSLLMIVIVVTHRPCHTVSNLLTCNMSVILAVYCISHIVSSAYGFHEDSALNQPSCAFRAYCHLMTTMSISYSYLIQSVSRLFFTIFSKHRYLVTYRVHWYLIVLNWFISISLSSVPFLFDNNFVFEKESRLCTPTTKNVKASIYCIIIGFVIPLNLSIIIYHIIFYHALKSSRRIAPSTSNSVTAHIPNARREMKLARNMVILETTFGAAGAPMLILVIWQLIQSGSSPPEWFYLLSVNAITFFVPVTMIVLFCMNKQVKDISLRYIHCRRQRINRLSVWTQPILPAARY